MCTSSSRLFCFLAYTVTLCRDFCICGEFLQEVKFDSQCRMVLAPVLSTSTMIRRWLREQNIPNVYVEANVKAELLEDSTDFEFIRTYETGIFFEDAFLHLCFSINSSCIFNTMQE